MWGKVLPFPRLLLFNQRVFVGGFGQQSEGAMLHHFFNLVFRFTEKQRVTTSADCVRLVQTVGAPLAKRQCVAQSRLGDCLWSAVDYWIITFGDNPFAIRQAGKLKRFVFLVDFDAVKQCRICFGFCVGVIVFAALPIID